MRVLYIGGTGEISYSCLHESSACGQHCTVFNRGRRSANLPPGTRQITGQMGDSAYAALARENFDVVCQFIAYSIPDVERDLAIFSGHCGQYVFISTASAYRKPPDSFRITERVPLINPWWAYSRTKADMEAFLLRAHAENRLPVTIIRPSHTYRLNFPGTFVGGDHHAWRMLQGKPVISHGDGTSLWTYTHSDDFAVPFVRLLGHPKALGEAFHITTDTAYPWDELFRAVGRSLGVEPKLVHVPSDTLVRYNSDWAGPLLGDKTWSTLFDNSKCQALTGPYTKLTPLDEGLKRAADHFRADKAYAPQPAVDALLDRIADEQMRLGAEAGG